MSPWDIVAALGAAAAHVALGIAGAVLVMALALGGWSLWRARRDRDHPLPPECFTPEMHAYADVLERQTEMLIRMSRLEDRVRVLETPPERRRSAFPDRG